jgi:hypothetical protein
MREQIHVNHLKECAFTGTTFTNKETEFTGVHLQGKTGEYYV